MTQYQINEGQEDPHGEMTGTITVNMVLSMVPVVLLRGAVASEFLAGGDHWAVDGCCLATGVPAA